MGLYEGEIIVIAVVSLILLASCVAIICIWIRTRRRLLIASGPIDENGNTLTLTQEGTFVVQTTPTDNKL